MMTLRQSLIPCLILLAATGLHGARTVPSGASPEAPSGPDRSGPAQSPGAVVV